MVLIISEAIIHETTNMTIEKLCDEYDNKQEKVNAVKSLNTTPTTSQLWETCKMNNNYLISTDYPHYIKRKNDDKVMKFRYNKGYVLVNLDSPQLHHQVIAQQFIPNPDKLKQVDHINHDTTDNRIDNLRWVSTSENNRNRASTMNIVYEFIDEIPNDSIKITEYNHRKYNNYYLSISQQQVYYFNGAMYKILPKRRKYNVNLIDINGKNSEVSVNSLIEFYEQ